MSIKKAKILKDHRSQQQIFKINKSFLFNQNYKLQLRSP